MSGEEEVQGALVVGLRTCTSAPSCTRLSAQEGGRETGAGGRGGCAAGGSTGRPGECAASTWQREESRAAGVIACYSSNSITASIISYIRCLYSSVGKKLLFMQLSMYGDRWG